ncbi:dephospho-CoA kinase [Fibrobacterota bacterium]
MDKPSQTFLLGITGGIGSGKTTVCRMLEKLGAQVFYADGEAKKIMSENSRIRKAIEKAFGEGSYTPEGIPDNRYLSGKVFGNEENLQLLNRIVHPQVYRVFEQAAARARETGADLLVLEAALIFESGGDRFLDAVAVVDTPLEDRLSRTSGGDAVSREQVLVRMQHQLAPDQLRKRADFILDNHGSPEELQRQVQELYSGIVHNP